MKPMMGMITLAVLIIILVGCGTNSPNNNSSQAVLKSIQVTSASTSVAAGMTLQLAANGGYSDGSSKDVTSAVTWVSSDTSRATVTSAGMVTGKAPGSVTITATSGSVTGNAGISVVSAFVTSITAINPPSATIAALTQQQFRAIAKLSDGTSADITNLVTWTVSPSTAASVSNIAGTNGLVTANDVSSTSTATVTATCSQPTCVAQSGAPSLSASLTVTNATPTSIAISPTSKTIPWGNQLQFAAIGTFSDGTTQDITTVCSPSACINWASSKPTIVSVTSSSGVALGRSVGGPALITATFRTITSNSASVSVDLSNLVSIAVTASTNLIANGTQLAFSAIGTFVDGSTRNLASTNAVNWSSSLTTVASISPTSGVATSTGQGVTNITATAGGKSGSTALQVQNASLQSMAVAPANYSIAVGTQLWFTVVGTFVSCSSCPFDQVLTRDPTTSWSSSTSAVSINSIGLATGIAAGSTSIRATSSLAPGGISASVPLNVTSAKLVAIAVTPANTFVPPGAYISYRATGTFSDNSTQALTNQLTWSTSNSSVATISSTGQAIAQGRGSVNISAQVGSVTGTTSLLVTSSPLTSISITPADAKLAKNTVLQLKALGKFADGSVQDLTSSANWSSSNNAVASIGVNSGILTALTPGSTSVTATFGSVSGSTSATVTNATLVSILVSPSSASVSLGGSVGFSAKATFDDGTTQNLLYASWSSTNPNVAIVTTYGLAVSSGVGSTTISAALNGVKGTAVLTVH